ncbi:MAG: winged helix-turn-helix domain-containing protein [Alphaproteobacteria bacterium]|nr:winged helix-turn-helix domain-containing protein [Alphaproteobacteria bacterium]
MARRRENLSAATARRIALAAQGFAEDRPDGPVGVRQLRRMIDRLGLLQIDSVNVLVRAHYLPLFSRLGPYDTALLDRQAWGGRKRTLFEYWGHEASLLPLDAQPLLRWRMGRAAAGNVGFKNYLMRYGRERRAFIEAVRRQIEDRGPLSAADLTDGGKSAGKWWGWSEGKQALEWLFVAGDVTTSGRRGAFERVYDLTERVIPADVLARPTPDEGSAQRALLLRAAQALGVATEYDLRDYFRLGPQDTKARLAELVEAGELLPVTVEGWDRAAYLDPRAHFARAIEARALLVPFDPLVWERDRAERLFGFRYRIEIYTPVEKRQFGYYVLPFLLGDRLVARVDLKADRANSRLLVHAAHAEAGTKPAKIAEPLRAELRLMADWLGLETVKITRAGSLGRALAK